MPNRREREQWSIRRRVSHRERNRSERVLDMKIRRDGKNEKKVNHCLDDCAWSRAETAARSG
jgi:hypothetical protein